MNQFNIFLILIISINYIYCSDIPQQIHIAYGGINENGDINGMRISYQTISSTKTSTVKYGLKSGEYDTIVTGEQSTYYETYDHHILLSNLKSNTKYFYICGDDESGWSKEYSFISAPTYDNFEYPINIAMIGDMGIYNSDNTLNILKELKNDNAYDFIWHVGDISYADDAFLHHPFEFNYEATWNEYINEMEEIVAEIPWMVCPGNHEAECHSPACQTSQEKLQALSNFTAYNNRFKMPYEESDGALNMWYSFNYGPIHMTNINTETDWIGEKNKDHYTLYRPDGKNPNGNFGHQKLWVEKDLKKANLNRKKHPYIFVGGHKPMYSIGKVDSNNMLDDYSLDMQKEWEDLFYETNINGYFSGHKHTAERSVPVYNYTVMADVDGNTITNQKAPIYVVNGAGGNTEGLGSLSNKPPQEWNAWIDDTNWGVGIITLLSDTKYSWKFYSADDLSVLDDVTISTD